MIMLGGKKVDAPLEIVQIFWLQLEILHSEQILSKKFDKRLQFRYRSVNFVSMYSNMCQCIVKIL